MKNVPRYSNDFWDFQTLSRERIGVRFFAVKQSSQMMPVLEDNFRIIYYGGSYCTTRVVAANSGKCYGIT